MRKITTLFLALTVCLTLSAGDFAKPTKILRLYPEGQGVDKGIVENGVAVTLGPLQNNGRKECTHPTPHRWDGIGDDAQIHLYLPKKCNGQMIVSCPGGGYQRCNNEQEGIWLAQWCLKRGIACCVVLYRAPLGKYDKLPLWDVQNAFRYCRHHAAEWGVSKIGIAGFSAGGHLAATASNLWVDDVTRPDFSILFYPVITFGAGTHSGSCERLAGDNACKREYYSMERQVSIRTPETLLVCCEDDPGVPVRHSLLYYEALCASRVPSELHVLTKGGHGFGFAETGQKDDRMDENTRAQLNSILENWLDRHR